jgi:hypothetical protein
MAAMTSTVWRGPPTVLIALCGRDSPTDAESAEYPALGRQILDETPTTEPGYSLAFSDGGGPTAAQRSAAPPRI